jgi:cbb3-type cytochrome oxidase subunit 1
VPFWAIRAIAGLAMFGGLIALITNIFKTLKAASANA